MAPEIIPKTHVCLLIIKVVFFVPCTSALRSGRCLLCFYCKLYHGGEVMSKKCQGSYNWLRHFLGVVPIFFLKVRMRWLQSEKPVSWLI